MDEDGGQEREIAELKRRINYLIHTDEISVPEKIAIEKSP